MASSDGNDRDRLFKIRIVMLLHWTTERITMGTSSKECMRLKVGSRKNSGDTGFDPQFTAPAMVQD